MKTSTAILLLAFAAPSIGAAASTTHLCESNGDRLQQLRIYEVNRSNREHFHERFRDHAARIMKAHDFDIVDIWESDSGEKLQFVYVLEWPDQATMMIAGKRCWPTRSGSRSSAAPARNMASS